ncbi:hypothetical protein K501DRAFT_266213 [Backusella circina FSU 941]|nr:hypothetical protein K501DRAFT_266213 [Backusella circina FSU 941]
MAGPSRPSTTEYYQLSGFKKHVIACSEYGALHSQERTIPANSPTFEVTSTTQFKDAAIYIFTNSEGINRHAPTYLIEVDEYLSSQVCALCHTRTKKYAQDAIVDDIYPVLVCSSYNTHWNRDHMASLNMRSIFMYMDDHNSRRLKPFARPPKKKKIKT